MSGLCGNLWAFSVLMFSLCFWAVCSRQYRKVEIPFHISSCYRVWFYFLEVIKEFLCHVCDKGTTLVFTRWFSYACPHTLQGITVLVRWMNISFSFFSLWLHRKIYSIFTVAYFIPCADFYEKLKTKAVVACYSLWGIIRSYQRTFQYHQQVPSKSLQLF